ncbi:MAG: hypothetical protein HY594_03410, partial [Candidatus Omnitrophica bacterium]|nr:hypothetical protein [Candidatus Omnitrophota bacterium]
VGPIGIAINSMIHELVSERMWGRVFSSMGIVMNCSLLLGIGAGGFFADGLTPAGTLYLFAGLLLAAGGIGLMFAYARGCRRRPVI